MQTNLKESNTQPPIKSVATVRCEKNELHLQVTTEFNSEKIIKSDPYMPNLLCPRTGASSDDAV